MSRRYTPSMSRKQRTWRNTAAWLLLVLAGFVLVSGLKQRQARGMAPPGPERHADMTIFLGLPLLLAVGAGVLFWKDRRNPPM